LDGAFSVASSAVSSEEIGNPVYPPVKRLLSQMGIDCSKKRARKLTEADGENYD
jgi:protein-tyrosine phosphatase